ncbi:acetylglutamate kinase [Sphingobacteriaceae bacterium]|nr:acetylglutamate kinase [Sphingobacteriaceae bacterium]
MELLSIVKIGGNVIDDENALFSFLKNFSLLAGKKILVHGGGKLANQLQEKLGVAVNMIEGRRVTDAETLKVVTMVYAGYINKTVVAKLQALNCNAVGLSGADANSIVSHKRETKKIDYGFVGDIDEINSGFISNCLEHNLSPVFSAITHNKSGQLLNTNADTIASELAMALTKNYSVRLIYCFEKNGVLQNITDEKSVIKEITHQNYLELKDKGIINAGMIPKMDNAFKALENGVNFVQIGKAEKLPNLMNKNDYEGTRLYK